MLAGFQGSGPAGFDFSGMFGKGVPSYDDIVAGRDMLRFEKVPVKFSDFKARIFDMTVPEEVEDYSKTVLEIMQGCQTKECVLLKHETQPMKCKNGEGWKNYIEWAKYEINDSLVNQIKRADEAETANSGDKPDDGVFAKI